MAKMILWGSMVLFVLLWRFRVVVIVIARRRNDYGTATCCCVVRMVMFVGDSSAGDDDCGAGGDGGEVELCYVGMGWAQEFCDELFELL